MCDFCLPDTSKPRRAASKVDKNQVKYVIFVYLTLQIRPARIQKQNKISKNRENVLLGYLCQNIAISDYGQISEIMFCQ